MLDVSSTAAEAQLGVDFAEIYANSELYKYVLQSNRLVLSRAIISLITLRLIYWDYSVGIIRNSSNS